MISGSDIELDITQNDDDNIESNSENLRQPQPIIHTSYDTENYSDPNIRDDDNFVGIFDEDDRLGLLKQVEFHE